MAICKLCEQECIIELDPEDYDESTSSAAGGPPTSVPDDLQLLACGCHFHWQCLLDESSQIKSTSACPSCDSAIVTNNQVLTNYHNEGGMQERLNILSEIAEEAYLIENPSHRPARAFLTMCAEGDVTGISELLSSLAEDVEEDDLLPFDLIRYQDPLDSSKSALHIAVEKQQYEVMWLLLWTASSIPQSEFPADIVLEARNLGLGRESAAGIDIRGLKDFQGRTAAQIAAGMANDARWRQIVQYGILHQS